MTLTDLHTFISRHHLAVLASVSDSGQPQAALIGIAVTDNLEIVFDTVRTSRKYANLIAHPSAALVIGWEGEVAVQYEGRAEELAGNGLDADHLREVYFRRFPDGRDRLNWPGITHFVVRPRWIRYCDFSRQPPDIQEFSI